MRIILSDMDEADWILGVRAAKWILASDKKDAILSYGEGISTKDFYVKKNKASVTVRPTNWTHQ